MMSRHPVSDVVCRPEWWRPPQEVRGDSRLAFAALLMFTFIAIIAPQSFIPALRPFRIAFLVGFTAIAAHLVSQFLRGRPLFVRTREISTATCLVTWAIVTIPFSYWPGGGVAFLMSVYFKTLAIFWLLGTVVNTLPRLRMMAWALALMSVPLAITGIKNFMSGSFWPSGHDGQAPVNRIIGYDAPLALNPNDLALMLNLIIPLGIALFLSARQAATRAILAALVTLAAMAVIITFSRAGFLTLATIMGIYLWKLRRRSESRWMWGTLVAALLSAPLLPSGYWDRLTTILDVESDPTGSAQARWADTWAAVRIVGDSPIVGAGIGQNILAMNEYRGAAWTHVHNVYLEYAVDLGIPGLGLFLLLLVQSLGSARFAQREAEQTPALGDLFYLAQGVQVSLLAFMVAGLFHPVGYQLGFYYFAGLAAATRVIAEASA